jgi:hypothetical protein
MEIPARKFDNPLCMETRRRTTSRRTAGATAICILIALFACASGHVETVPHVRFVLVERSRSIAGSRPADSSVVDAAVGDSLGRLLWRNKPLALVGVLPEGGALVRFSEDLAFVRSDSMGRWPMHDGPIGPETLVVRSGWAHLTTPTYDGGRDYAIRLLSKGRAASQPSGLWHDRYSKDFPALGDPVKLDTPAEVVRQVQAECTDSLAARRMQVTLFMWVLVSKEGTVLATRSFDRDSLTAASADACVRQWTYRPARYMGNPVASWLSTNVEVCKSAPRGGR